MATYQIIQPDAANTTYNIADGTYCNLQYPNGIGGIGLPNVTRDLQRHPNIEGAFDHGYKLEPREVNLNLYYNVTSAAAADARRDAIYKIFRPFDDPLKLKVTRDDAAVRQLDVHTVGMLDLPMSERVGYDQAFSVRLMAPNPIWYDPSQQTTTFTPAATPWFGNITYTGDWESFPIIKVYGAVTNFYLQMQLVTAAATTTYLLFAASIGAGDIYTYDLTPGIKSAKNNAGTSVLGDLSADSYTALFGMRLWPSPLESGGVNRLDGAYSTKDASHKVEVLYYRRYMGL